MKDKETNVPEIRFQGFTDAWEQRKLEEIVDILDGDRGVNYPNGDELRERGHTLFLSATNVTKDGFVFDNNKYITEEKSNRLGNGKLVADDIVLTSRGSIGHVAWYNAAVKQQVPFARINSGMLILRCKGSTKSCFVAQFLKSPLGKKQIDLISFGSAQPQLTKKDVSKYIISLPCDSNEQIQLGKFFNHIDNLVTLHKRKLDKLKELKKVYLQKMFPQAGESVPRVRFAGFIGPWVQRRLGEMAEIAGGGTPSTSIDEYWNGDIDWYSPIEIGKKIFVESSQKKITKIGLQKSSAKILPVGTVLFTSRASIGNTAILAKEGATNQGFQSIIPNGKKLDSYFIFSRTDELKHYGETNGAGSTFVEVSGKQMAKMPINIPSLEEQITIGRFFRNLDDQISVQHQKLDQLKQLKRSYLQKMFL